MKLPIFLVMLAGIICTALADYGPGVTDSNIKIGNTSPYSGPASAYGTIGKALVAYFNKINDEGGINGRKIEFISLDDGYSPPKTKEQYRKLVEREQVLLVFQSLGTPTNSAVHEYMNQKQVPHLFLASGASQWGQPRAYPWTMGFQPSYQTEAQIYARYILDNVPDAKISVLYQNDDYGKDYLQGLRDGIGERAEAMIVATQSYEVTDPTISAQIIALKNSDANVFINISTPKFAAQAIKKIAELNWSVAHFLNSVSNSVGAVLEPAGLEQSTGLISAQYFKDPTDPRYANDSAYQEWRGWMAQYYPDGDPLDRLNVYAYLAGQLLVQVLRQAGDELTRENIMRQAASLRNLELGMLIPGVRINTDAEDYFPIEAMQLARFNGKSWEPLGEVIDMESSK